MDEVEGSREHSQRAFKELRLEFVRLHEPRTVSAEIELIPRGEPSESKFKSNLAGEASTSRAQPVPEPATKRGKSAASSIRVEPSSLFARVSMFNELEVRFAAPDGERVSFVYMRNDAQAVEMVPMERTNAGPFQATVELEDGSYLTVFKVDSCVRTEARIAQQVYVKPDCVLAPLRLAREQMSLTIHNDGTSPENIWLKPNAPWIVIIPSTFNLPSGESARVAISFDRRIMTAGLNEDSIELLVEREGVTRNVTRVKVQSTLKVDGAVPEIVWEPKDLGPIRQGIDRVAVNVRIRSRGVGALAGMISSPESGELVDFCLDAADASSAELAHTFQIDSSFLPKPQPHRQEASLRFDVVTDSFLANRRLFRVQVPYRLVYLRNSLPALSFGNVRAGNHRVLRLDVTCSDGREIDLEVEVPPEAGKYLGVYQARPNAYVFRFTTSGLAIGTSINEFVELIDRKSGLRDRIKVLGTVSSDDRHRSNAEFPATIA